jgi:small subunit ribosomal protein S5
VRSYIDRFNADHKGRINLLDFSNYSTKFNDFKEGAISRQDMDVIREFQKRKIDQRLHTLHRQRNPKQPANSPLEYQREASDGEGARDEEIDVAWSEQPRARNVKADVKGWFDVDDDFVMILIERNTSTKVTTLNRINYYRTLLFMGNGNGLISYGKSRDLTPEGSMTKAITECKRNIIALPLDNTCTLPRPITSKFQDYLVYLRPCAGFNSWGHPMFSMMLALSGIRHVGFKTVHTDKNNYTMLHSFFKAVTQNTTPQEMAEKEGFKYYRRRFVRPLTEHDTHNHLSY